jgi:Alpha-(1,3)-fucosyltransferase FucT N-terminal domain/Glycosyltransferase family 10 (fucosyltransferase) C-term
MTSTLRISTLGVSSDYRSSVTPQVLASCGYLIEWVDLRHADLLIVGPFASPKKHSRWTPKPLRPMFEAIHNRFVSPYRPLTLFQTGENIRHDHIACDYAISFDLGVNTPNHYRMPYWMEVIDWSDDGITGNQNPRFGSLVDIKRLMRPLGNQFLTKPFRAALFASHVREPRRTLIEALKRHMEVQGFGPAFDSQIKHHSSSHYTKKQVLENYRCNLCPENNLYPGYYTEKILEAFAADSLPLTWTDSCVNVDFNPDAMINLAPMMAMDFEQLEDAIQPASLKKYAEQPLMHKPPSIQGLRQFLQKIAHEATS